MLLGLFSFLPLLSAVIAWTSPGCNKPGFQLDSNGHYNRTLPSGRQYLLHVPPEYTAGKGHPLVLSFHGAGGTSAQQERLSQFSEPGLRIAGLPIVTAYPQGADNKAENRTGVWYSAPYYNKTVDDVQFAKDIVKDLLSNYCIDSTLVFASGKSNGGGFTAYLACRQDTSLLFAAFAPVSPALYPESLAFSGCNPARPVPIITSHGVLDTTIPFNGRNNNGTYGVGNNGGLPDPTNTSEPFANTTEYIWNCNATVQAYTVKNLGHSWPTTAGLDNSGAPNNTASFNLTKSGIVQFFSTNPLPPWALKG